MAVPERFAKLHLGVHPDSVGCNSRPRLVAVTCYPPLGR
jgi:hypothetical protein